MFTRVDELQWMKKQNTNTGKKIVLNFNFNKRQHLSFLYKYTQINIVFISIKIFRSLTKINVEVIHGTRLFRVLLKI